MAGEFGMLEKTLVVDLQRADDRLLEIAQHIVMKAVTETPEEDQRCQTDGDAADRQQGARKMPQQVSQRYRQDDLVEWAACEGH
jgi:hypothetical protein